MCKGFGVSWFEVWEKRLLDSGALSGPGIATVVASDLTDITEEVDVYWMMNV